MRIKLSTTIFLLFTFCIQVAAQSWQEVRSVHDICKAYPTQMKNMFSHFNLETPSMKKVKQAYNSGELEEACKQLLLYYKNGDTSAYLRLDQPVKSDKTNAIADTTLKNVFIIQNVRGEVPWGNDGHRDWYYKGPNNDREWAWLSNRHSQISQVFSAYFQTGNPKYAIYIDEFLRDFIIKSMPYPAKKSSESVWRGLEVAARVKVWSRIFYGFLNNEYFSDATRLLILSSLPDHAHYNRNFHRGNNWLTMEISALATAASNWPELKKSNAWLEYAAETIAESMKGQVYEDGTQTELTSHYHNVAMRNFVLFKQICDRAQFELPPFFDETIEKMYSYIAHAVRPDGNRILNNDGDLGSDVPLILEGAKEYNKPNWEYIATNGESGIKPNDVPSYFYPWAGQLVSRSGFDKEAHWSFFDVGPWGSGHQHNDKLHISVSAFGRDLLVDAGRFAYTGEVAKKFRGYAKGTQGHNTVLIDGKGQMPDKRVIDEPLSENHWKITPEFDYAWNSFENYFDIENVKHTRSLMYVRGEFWVVLDKIESKTPRKVETLWHWHPNSKVQIFDNRVVGTKNNRGNLKVIPVNKKDWTIEVIEGQEKPEIQGWYSKEYNQFEHNKTTIYSRTIENTETFVWLLIPSEKETVKVQARIISENSEGVVLEVKQRGKGSWQITLPYANSKAAKVEKL